MRLHKDAKAELIRSLPLFADCTPAEVAEVAAIADEIDLGEGRQLTTQGSDGQEFVVIIDGTAEVLRDGEKLTDLGAGDFFGELALITGEKRSASVIATSSVHALVIEGHAFRRLLEDAPDIREKVERALAERS